MNKQGDQGWGTAGCSLPQGKDVKPKQPHARQSHLKHPKTKQVVIMLKNSSNHVCLVPVHNFL